MTNKNCLNCEKELIDQYCSGCGQKADTHRITFKNFIFHDVLHGTFHIERGMLFTAKQSLVRPGKAALDYIAGKRKPYYNVFLLVLLTFGLILFFFHFYDTIALMLGEKVLPEPVFPDEVSRKMDAIISEKLKIFIFLFVPFAALNSFILFRRKKLNVSEHSIIAGMILLGMLLISLIGNLIFYIELITPFHSVLASIIRTIIIFLIIFQIPHGYFEAFSSDYTKFGFFYRMVLFFGLFFLEIYILFLLIFGIISDWKFGKITLSLFS